MAHKTKIVLIVTLLELGGAQQTALTLLRNLNPDRFAPVLLCGQGGLLDSSALETGIRVRFVPDVYKRQPEFSHAHFFDGWDSAV